MGGRGSTSASGKASLSKMSYDQLDSELRKVDSKMSKLGKTMERTASGHMAFMNGMPGSRESDSTEYRKAQREYQRLQGVRGDIIDEWAKKKPKQMAKPRTFVNGFGEATTRVVESASYKNAMRRNEREIRAWMKGWR